MKRIFVLAVFIFSYYFACAQVQILSSNIGNNLSVVYPGNLGSPATIPSGLMITFKSSTTITGAATLNVNGSGAKPIKKQVSVDLVSGDILAGQFVTVIFDGVNFQLLSSIFSSNSTSWLVGGNSVTGSSLLGTLNNKDLTIVTNSIPGIRISAAASTPGYVGIGTLTPSMPLHVSSSIPYYINQSYFNGSAMFENTYLSNSSSIGIGMYAKSTANEFGVGGVIDGGQLGLYVVSQVTGSGVGARIGIQTRASGGASGIGVDANSFGTNNSVGGRLVGNSTIGDAKGIDVRGSTQDGIAYGVIADAISGTNIAYGGSFSASSSNSDSYGGNFSSNSSNGASYGVKSSSVSTLGATIGIDISSQSNSTGMAYGQNIIAYSNDNVTYGSNIYSYSNNGSNSYGENITNFLYNTSGTAYGSYIYNSGYGASTGLQVTNYAGTGYSSIGLYASAFGGSANYSGYFANGDVFVNDRIGVGTSNPSEKITVENSFYGITHRNGTGIGSAIMSTYIGNSYTTSFIPGASIGTQSDHPFFIYINNSGEKFYIGNSTQSYNVGIGTASPAAKLEVNGFTKLGSNAPSIKTLMLTGTTASTEGGLVSLSLGSITPNQIISISVMVDWSGSGSDWIQPSWVNSSGYYFNWLINGSGLTIVNQYNLSAVPPQRSNSILSKAIRAFIVYTP